MGLSEPTVEIDGFSPSPRQREIKAEFIVKLRKAKVYNANWTRAAIEHFLGYSLAAHWSTPFKEYLLNTDEFEVAAELAAQEALQACRQIVTDPSEKGQARATAAKLIMTIANKEPKKVVEKYADESISKLAQDPAKLKAFLKESITKVFSQDEIRGLLGASDEV